MKYDVIETKKPLEEDQLAMSRVHVSNGQESKVSYKNDRMPAFRSRKVGDTTDNDINQQSASAQWRELKNEIAAVLEQRKCSSNGIPRPKQLPEKKKALQIPTDNGSVGSLSTSPKWSRIKSKFEYPVPEENGVKRAEAERRSRIPEKQSSAVVQDYKPGERAADRRSLNLSKKADGLSSVNQKRNSCSNLYSNNEYKSARLAARRLLESRVKQEGFENDAKLVKDRVTTKRDSFELQPESKPKAKYSPRLSRLNKTVTEQINIDNGSIKSSALCQSSSKEVSSNLESQCIAVASNTVVATTTATACASEKTVEKYSDEFSTSDSGSERTYGAYARGAITQKSCSTEERVSKVASLTKSFENLSLQSKLPITESCRLLRGTVGNRSLPSSILHDIKLHGRQLNKSNTVSNIPMYTLQQRPKLSDIIGNFNCQGSLPSQLTSLSFRDKGSSGSLERLPTMRDKVVSSSLRRSNSVASQSSYSEKTVSGSLVGFTDRSNTKPAGSFPRDHVIEKLSKNDFKIEIKIREARTTIEKGSSVSIVNVVNTNDKDNEEDSSVAVNKDSCITVNGNNGAVKKGEQCVISESVGQSSNSFLHRSCSNSSSNASGSSSPKNSRKLSLVQQAVMNLEGNGTSSSLKSSSSSKLSVNSSQSLTDAKAKLDESISEERRFSLDVAPRMKNSRSLSAPFERKEFSRFVTSSVESDINESTLSLESNLKDGSSASVSAIKKGLEGRHHSERSFLHGFSRSASELGARSGDSTPPIPQPRKKWSLSPEETPSYSNNKLLFSESQNSKTEAQAVPNNSFLWKTPRPFQSSSTSGSTKSEDSGYVSLGSFKTENSTDEKAPGQHGASRKMIPPPVPPVPPKKSDSLPPNYERYMKTASVDSDEGQWADVSDAELEHGKNASGSNQMSWVHPKGSRRLNHRRDRRSWSQSLKELVVSSLSSECGSEPKDYEDIMWEVVEGDSSSASSTTYDHLYEPIYDVLDKDDIPDLIRESENIYAVPHMHEPQFQKLVNRQSASYNQSEDKTASEPEARDVPCQLPGLKRNWSLTQSDIRLEYSSKLNQVKLKKNTKSATEIGVGVQVQESGKPKKKAFIKCILRQKHSSQSSKQNSSSSKKETATFYVRLSLDHDLIQKHRPRSESFTSEGRLMRETDSQTSTSADNPAIVKRRPVRRMSSSAGSIRRPKTPPPLPPTAVSNKSEKKSPGISSPAEGSGASVKTPESEGKKYESLDQLGRSESSLSCFSGSAPSGSQSGSDSLSPMDEPFPVIMETSLMTEIAHLTNVIPSIRMSVASSPDSVNGDEPEAAQDAKSRCQITVEQVDDSNLTDSVDFLKSPSSPDLLKSPFQEEPLYQFYQKDLVQRASLWQTADGSATDAEDDNSSLADEISTQIEESSQEKPKVQHSAMELLQHGSSIGQRTLWCEVPEVIASGVLQTMTTAEARLQEAMFEVITSEASYLKSLNILIEHFLQHPLFNDDSILQKRERHALFGDIIPVRDVSECLLADLSKRWEENIVISEVCDILYKHASENFSVYVKYCSNQIHQDRLLKELKETRPEFVEGLQKLESDPVCQCLDMYSFLMLPMQRITRLPLLIDAIFRKLEIDSPRYEICHKALMTVNHIASECNEGAKKMERMEEMLHLSRILEFKECKGIPLISSSRWLVKKGELTKLTFDLSAKRTFGRSARCTKSHIYAFLFTDLLVITKKKSEEYYSVIDYCPRNMVQVSLLEGEDGALLLPPRLPDCCRNLFQMTILQNHENKTVEMILSCSLESERTRWIDALTPIVSSNPEERIYEEWDCPQVQCIHPYVPEQPDELALDKSDVVNVFRKMSDGWFEGERIRDGVRGWFPGCHTIEVINSHVRARNLRQRYRLLMATHNFVEGQLRAQKSKSK